jgi:XisH protein
LIANGWTITHDPLVLQWGSKDLFVDLGAERLLAADKGDQKIAVEVKSFSGASDIDDLEKALGQFILYHDILEEREPDRRLYLAIPKEIHDDLFQEPVG